MKVYEDEGTTLVQPEPTKIDVPITEPAPPPEVRNFYPLIGLVAVVLLGLLVWALLPTGTPDYTGDWKDSVATEPAETPADYTGDWKDSVTTPSAETPADYTGDWKDSVTTPSTETPADDTGDWKDTIAE
jgi:hypothetical protein